MATTYGERLLAEAEDRSRRKKQLRRLIVVFAPAAIATVMAIIGTIGFRQQRIDEGLIRSVMDAGMVLLYGVILVLGPLYAAFAPAPNALMASVALATGPIAMPILLGPGWRVWHRAVVILACLLVIAARKMQPRPKANLLRRRGRRR